MLDDAQVGQRAFLDALQQRTETVGRDSGFDVAISTDTRTNSTQVFIDEGGRDTAAFGKHGTALSLDGRQARTLYRALQRHFEAQGKSIS